MLRSWTRAYSLSRFLLSKPLPRHRLRALLGRAQPRAPFLQFWLPAFHRGLSPLERVQQIATEMTIKVWKSPHKDLRAVGVSPGGVSSQVAALVWGSGHSEKERRSGSPRWRQTPELSGAPCQKHFGLIALLPPQCNSQSCFEQGKASRASTEERKPAGLKARPSQESPWLLWASRTTEVSETYSWTRCQASLDRNLRINKLKGRKIQIFLFSHFTSLYSDCRALIILLKKAELQEDFRSLASNSWKA